MTKTKKEYLNQIKNIDEILQCNQEELRSLRELSTSITGSSTDSVKVMSSKNDTEAKYASVIHQIAEMEEAISKSVEESIMLKMEVRNTIMRLKNPTHRLVLLHKYVHGLTWLEICDKMEIAETTAYKYHSLALESLEI